MSKDNTIHEIVLTNMVRLRQERGWNKSELARRAEIDQSHISNIENRKKHMGLDLLSRIARAFEVEPYEMLREYDVSKISLMEKLHMIEELPEIKRIAIEQMVNAFLRESQG